MNRETQRKINLISNELPVQFISTYANTTLTKTEPKMALLSKSFQPIFYVNQVIAISTITLDFKCIVSKKNSDIILVDTLAVKNNNDLTFICYPIVINSIGEQYTGYYLVRLVVASRMNPNNVIDIFNTPTIYFVNKRSLQLHPTSPIALPENTKLNATFNNFLSSVTSDYSEIKFLIGGNNFSPSQITAETIGIDNGPTLSTGGYMSIEIWFKSLVSSTFDFSFSSYAFQFPFIQQNTLSFNASFLNGAYTKQPFISKLRYNGFLGFNSPVTTIAPPLHNRVYCVIGDYIVKASQYDYIDSNTAEFECNLKYSNKGVINGGLFLDTNNGYIKLQNIDVNYIIVEKLTISKFIPYTALIQKTNIPFDITFYVSDNPAPNYIETILFCFYNTSNGLVSERFKLIRNNDGTFSSKITAYPPTRDIVKFHFMIETIATNTTLLYSNNGFGFVFQEPVPLVYLDPFVTFNDFKTGINTDLTIRSNVSLLTDYFSSSLFCSFIYNDDSTSTRVRAMLSEDKKQITCRFVRLSVKDLFNMDLSVDYLRISLVQRDGKVEDGIENYLTLSQNEIHHAIIKTPILLSENPNYFINSDIGVTSFNLNFKSLQSTFILNLLMDYYLVNNVPTRLNIGCNSTPSSPICLFNLTGTVYQIPQPLAFTVSVGRVGQTQVYTSPITTTYYFISNVTINQAIPFVLDYNTSKVQNISFSLDTTTSPRLNTQNFTDNYFSCVLSGNNQLPSRANIKQDTFTCEVNGPTQEGHVISSLQFQLNKSLQTIGVSVSNGEDLEFSSLGFMSVYARKDGYDSHLLYYSNSSIFNYFIPNKYRNGNLQLKLYDTITDIGFNTFPCTIDRILGIVNCTKGIVYPDIGDTTILRRGIQLAYPYLLYNGNFLTKINKPFILYIPSSISVFPTAVFRQDEVTIEIQFSNKTLDISLDAYDKSINCLIDEKSYLGTIPAGTTNTMACKVLFIDFSSAFTSISSYLSIPSFSYSNLTLNTNNPIIYILDKQTISYGLFGGNGEESIMKNTDSKMVSIRINGEIPVSIKDAQNIKCVVEAYQSLSGLVETLETITQFWKYEAGSTFYNCSIKANSYFIGKGKVSIWYVEQQTKGSAVYSFELSSNNLPLYLVGYYNLQTSPIVTTINRTINIVLNSDLRLKQQANINYDIPVNYYIRSNHSVTGYLTNKLIESFPPSFSSYSTVPASLYVSIIMEINGVNLTATQTATFTFLDGFYHEPNYGLTTGGEYVLLLGHTYNPVEDIGKKMFFKEYPEITFGCTPVDGTLNCSTPIVSDSSNIPIFTNYIVQYGVKELATQYVLYDRVPSYILEQIYPTTNQQVDKLTNLVLVTSSNFTTKDASQFSLVIRKDENDPYPNIISFSNIINNVSLTIQSKISEEGFYETQLYFYSPFLFTQNNWIEVNQKQYLYFVNRRNVNFLNSKTLFYIEKDQLQTQSIYFSFDKNLLEEHLSFVVCKTNDGMIFETILVDNSKNTFMCNISSIVAETKFISIWLVNQKVYQGEFQISNNALEVIFVEKVSINEVRPYALVGITSSKVKLLLSPMITSTTLQVFNSSITQVVVMCSVASGFEGSNYFPFYKPIEITNEYAICSISKTTTADFINVKLVVYNSSLSSNNEILNNVVDITSHYIRIPFYNRNTLIRTYHLYKILIFTIW